MFVVQRSGEGQDVQTFVPPRDVRSRLVRTVRRNSLVRDMRRYKKSRPAGAEFFSDDRSQFGRAPLLQMPPCDILNLHWISEFLDYRSLFDWLPRRVPLVWTLHDMNAFTGGCHYDFGCEKHRNSCGACPQLGSTVEGDLSRQVWNRKRGAYGRISLKQMQLVTPSRWMAEEVGKSALLGRFPVAVIPNGLDVEVFEPRPRSFARDALGLPQKAKVLLFAAHTVSERRKGFSILSEALAGLKEDPNLFVLTVGGYASVEQVGLRCRSLGYISNERLLSIVYSAADLCVVPTLQDNLPNIAIESLACGVPIVAFAVGGLPDIVREGKTGILVPPGDVRQLRIAMAELLRNTDQRMSMAGSCRRAALEEYSQEVQARRYFTLYETLLGSAADGDKSRLDSNHN